MTTDPLPPQPKSKIPFKGVAIMVAAMALVEIFNIFEPGYHPFLFVGISIGISVGIGIIVAGVLYLRNKYMPIKEEEINNKRPLGLG